MTQTQIDSHGLRNALGTILCIAIVGGMLGAVWMGLNLAYAGAKTEVSWFGEIKRPTFDRACRPEGGRFLRIEGRTKGGDWIVACGNGMKKTDKTVRLDQR